METNVHQSHAFPFSENKNKNEVKSKNEIIPEIETQNAYQEFIYKAQELLDLSGRTCFPNHALFLNALQAFVQENIKNINIPKNSLP